MFKAVERIETVYFMPDSKAFMSDQIEYLMTSQQLGGGIFYISTAEVVQEHFKNHPERNCLLLQYNIPNIQQVIISQLYKEHKGVAGLISSFCASKVFRPKEIINVDYYAGYWDYSKEGDSIAGHFTPCDALLKKKMVDKMTLQMVSKKLPKLNKKLNENGMVLVLDILLSGFIYLMPQGLDIICGAAAFISFVLLLKDRFGLKDELHDMKELQNKIVLEDFEACEGLTLNSSF